MSPLDLFWYFVAASAGVVVLGLALMFLATVVLAIRGSLERVRR